MIATNNVHYATPARRPLATALAAVRARRSLDDIEPWLPASGGACLRSGDEQARRFARYPGVVEAAAELGRACAFDLALVAPQLPPFPVPPRHTEMTYLRALVEQGATERYGPRGAERVPGAYKQIDHELALIESLGFPGYFLVVWDLCDFARRNNIYCQGRGSAANSAVCYALGITNADAVSLGLLFERFLSPERDGPPDIDIDLESGRREEVIQYVYEKHGRQNAAQVANVITYRAKSAVRDMGRALGAAPGQLDAWAKEIDHWGNVAKTAAMDDITIPAAVMESGRCRSSTSRATSASTRAAWSSATGPCSKCVPVEWGRMPGRTVLQWDKDDCAAVGLVKFDLLGLGMLEALHGTVDLVREFHGVEVDLALIPQEDAVYDMVCEADTVGVFQIESRAQMATLPRLRPRHFYDLVVEIALIRPGPIQGGSVHPYIRRRNGEEPVTYLHPLLEKSLKKTLGVPLFQEQLMQMAIDVAGFSAADADQLRQAMGSKRSRARMEELRGRFFEGMAVNGIDEETGDVIWDKLAAFANYGFPESHSVSFAYLVYSSCWLKYHYPAAFCAALLNAQPMGFWSPATLTADARRHGVRVFGPDVNASRATACLEADPESAGGFAIRMGIGSVRSVGDEAAYTHRRRAAVCLGRRRGAPRRAGRGRARGHGHRRRVRLLRTRTTRGVVVGRRGRRSGAARNAARCRGRCWRAAVAGHDAGRDHCGRSVGHRRQPQQSRHRAHPSVVGASGRAAGERAAQRARPHEGVGWGSGDAPPASGHRRRHGVLELGRRDGADQRRVLTRRVEPLPPRRPRLVGVADPRRGRVGVQCRQPARRTHRDVVAVCRDRAPVA